MRVVFDIEANRLINPDVIHCIVCKDIDTEQEYIFRDYKEFLSFAEGVSYWVGHHCIGYDFPVLNSLLGYNPPLSNICDTLVVSRVVNYLAPKRKGKHSLKAWGEYFGIKKEHSDENQEFFREWSQELQDRCVSDVRITFRIFQELSKYITSPRWQESLRVEHEMAQFCTEIGDNGFCIDYEKTLSLLRTLRDRVASLDKVILADFPPKTKLIRVVTPKETKHGTISRTDFRWKTDGDLSEYTVGAPFSLFRWEEFNPGSVTQIVQRLNEAGWKPTERTQGYLDAIKDRDFAKVKKYETEGRGWKISENNLVTLPDTAPPGARSLASRIMYQSRVSDLEEIVGLAREENGQYRIHPNLSNIGAWTQRVSHRHPNTANIPTRKPQDTKEIAELNDTMRSLWIAGKGRILVGVDADQIQLRILAHYMLDEKFIDALVNGNKDIGTDVHSLNVTAIGPSCQGRRDAKTFIYAWLLGAGVARVAEILGCGNSDARDARERFISYYPGLKKLREESIIRDARNGYFEGLDKRYVMCYGKDVGERSHYMLGGYLQNGEKQLMSYARRHWRDVFIKEKIYHLIKPVNWVHDEWQVEVPDDMELAIFVSNTMAYSIQWAGEYLETKCPMKGSVNGGHEKLAIGKNWLETH